MLKTLYIKIRKTIKDIPAMPKTSIKNIIHIAWQAGVDTIDHDGIEHAGYIAFLFLLALFPFLVFFFAIVGGLGQSELGTKLVTIILDNALIPSSVLTALEPRIHEIVSGPPQGLLTISIIGAVWTASSSVEGLRTTLNRAYRVGTPPAYILRRLLSIGQFLILTAATILVTFILIIAPSIWATIKQFVDPSLWEQAQELFSYKQENFFLSHMWDYLRYAFTAAVLFGVVSITYYTLPNIKQRWHNVAPGACIVVCLWFISGGLLSGYLTNFEQVNLIYGSLGGVIGALLFFYLAATIFIYGAEFNYLLEKSLGHAIIQKEEVVQKEPHQ